MRHFTLIVFIAAALAQPTPSYATEVRAHGLLDMALSSGAEARALDGLTQGDSNFDPYRVRLFVDASVSPTLDLYLQSIVHEGFAALRADGAYAQWTPWPERDLHLQAGKIPWPIGAWAPRTYSDRNPLVGMPLMYQYHTSLAWNVPATSVDQLVASAGSGQYGVVYGRWWTTAGGTWAWSRSVPGRRSSSRWAPCRARRDGLSMARTTHRARPRWGVSG
jgi:hypothetical protein